MPDTVIITEAANAYLECAAWSTTAYRPNGEPIGLIDEIDAEWSNAAIEAAHREVENFWDDEVDEIVTRRNIPPAQVGHDLWLTRNHHGAGFWDRGLGDDGTRLTDLCRPCGDDDAYIGDDGQIHLTSEV